MKKVLFVIGSFRKKSTNRMLAEIVEKYISDWAEVNYLEYEDLPMINQDIEFPTPAEVQSVRDKIKEADGIWIFFPEYNYSYPGVLKNMLDWISRPVEKGAPRTTAVSSGKIVTYSSSSGSNGADRAFAKMDDLMAKIHMVVADAKPVCLNELKVIDGKLYVSEDQLETMKKQAYEFRDFLTK